jgi:hypothetical protein
MASSILITRYYPKTNLIVDPEKWYKNRVIFLLQLTPLELGGISRVDVLIGLIGKKRDRRGDHVKGSSVMVKAMEGASKWARCSPIIICFSRFLLTV